MSSFFNFPVHDSLLLIDDSACNATITLELFNCIDKKKGNASKWDLIKVVGTVSEFHYWIEEFVLGDKFVIVKQDSNRNFYRKTETEEILYKLLRNGRIMQVLLRVSGNRFWRN